MTILYDITTFEDTLNTLKSLFYIKDQQIIEFIRRENNSFDEFFKYFSIDERNLLERDLVVTSIHVTTNDDECASLKSHGLVNTVDAISINTPFKRHLDKHGIEIDCKLGEIKFKGIRYPFGSRFEGFSQNEEKSLLEHIAYKFYRDRQVNGFFCTDNALAYGGNVNRRPELMNNIANLLNYNELVEDWINNPNNKCYVIKFAVPLSTYSVDSFVNIPTPFESLTENDIDLLKKKSLIYFSLNNIKDYLFYNGLVRERISYLHPDSKVNPSDIVAINSDIEYQRTLL